MSTFFVCFIYLLIATISTTESLKSCTEDNDICFIRLQSLQDGFNYQQAVEACRANSSQVDLAQFNSFPEYATARDLFDEAENIQGWFNMIRNVSCEFPEDNPGCFVYPRENGTFSGHIFDIPERQPWNGGQPTDSSSGDCVMFNREARWEVTECSTNLEFAICQEVQPVEEAAGAIENPIRENEGLVVLIIGVFVVGAIIFIVSSAYLLNERKERKLAEASLSTPKEPTQQKIEAEPMGTQIASTIPMLPPIIGSLRENSSKRTPSDRKTGFQTIATQFSTAHNAYGDIIIELIDELCADSDDRAVAIVNKVMPFINHQTTRNLEKSETDGELSKIKSAEEGDVPLKHYLITLVSEVIEYFPETGNQVGPASLIYALIYMSRLEQSTEVNFALTEFNSHRLFAVFILIAAKYTEDESITNDYWATISELGVYELVELENLICFSLNFDFSIDPKEMTAFINLLKVQYRKSVRQ